MSIEPGRAPDALWTSWLADLNTYWALLSEVYKHKNLFSLATRQLKSHKPNAFGISAKSIRCALLKEDTGKVIQTTLCTTPSHPSKIRSSRSSRLWWYSWSYFKSISPGNREEEGSPTPNEKSIVWFVSKLFLCKADFSQHLSKRRLLKQV